MKLHEVVAWYQKEIGTYDKQPWEQTVEQRILNGFVNIPSKNQTLRTDYIDVDLVRGSTFPKAKPKQSLLTVLRLAIARYLFLPLYAKWWVSQTSRRIFAFLLGLYTLQMVNWAIYSYNVNKNVIKLNDSDTCSTNDRNGKASSQDEFVSLNELLVPMILSLMLSLVHSQIVATSSTSVTTTGKQKTNPIQMHRKKRERKKRRKSARNRSALNTTTGDAKVDAKVNKACLVDNKIESNTCDYQSIIKNSSNSQLTIKDGDCSASDCSPPQLRKRCVNWDSPIKSHVTLVLSPNARLSENARNDRMEELNGDEVDTVIAGADDDGFESLNGKSSSGEEMSAINNGLVEAIEKSRESEASKASEQFTTSVYNVKMFDDMNNSSDNELIDTTGSISENICDKMSMRGLLSMKCPRGAAGTGNNQVVENVQIYSTKPEMCKTHCTRSLYNKRDKLKQYSSYEEDDEEDEVDAASQPSSPLLAHQPVVEATTSATEWIGITTNSEECSYSSADNSGSQIEYSENNAGEWDYCTPAVILNSNCAIGDKINCTVWDGREVKKTEMSVLDISSAIIKRVEDIVDTCDYVYIGLVFSLVLSLVPAFCRLCEAVVNSSESNEVNFLDMPALLLEKTSFSYEEIIRFAFGEMPWQKSVLFIDFMLRFCLTFLFFFFLAVAERTFKQRFLYAKLFSHLTSSRRARKSELPHFRLNKVRNIKTWLSVRSYLKRRGPQRSVDVIVSTAFMLTLLLLTFLSVEWLKDSVQLQSQHNLEALIWSCALGCYLLRFMTLGTKINRKYRSTSVLITEQINLYLQIEQKPHNKDELMVSNSVLKLAADLLKELESPFKISGLCANPYLYTTIKVVILSALSGVLSEMLGFKLKLHKIKIK